MLRGKALSTTAIAGRSTCRFVTASASPRPASAHSVGSTGDSYDNALAETINGLYKAELVHRRGPWKSREAVELATLEWVSWFNHRRLLSSIGYVPPAEAEAAYCRQLNPNGHPGLTQTNGPPRFPGRFS